MNILLVYGGKSCEHDVSIITACLAKGYFDGNLYCAYFNQQNKCFLAPNSLAPNQHKGWQFDTAVTFVMGQSAICLQKGRRKAKIVPIDVAVNCCHGVNGEDGSVAGLLQMAGIPSVESGVIGSAICMDKYLSKLAFMGAGLPVLDGVLVSKVEYERGEIGEKLANLGYPVIVKPTTLGSSIGVGVAHNQAELNKALHVAFCFDERVLVERALTSFWEVNCSAMTVDGKVATSRADRPLQSGEILTFADKYLAGGKGFAPKSQVDDTFATQAQSLTKQIYQAFDMQGVVRVDYIVDAATNQMYVNEVNVVPGSLAYNLWDDVYTRRQFGKVLVQNALDTLKRKQSLTYRYQSTVLDGANFAKK